MKQFQYCVCIGRFQPFHHGHHELIKDALEEAEKVIIIIGSAGKAPNTQNPWSAEQREEIIKLSLSPEERARVKFEQVRDYWYTNNKWLTEVQQLVYELTEGIADSQICLIGEENDFPQWHFIKARNLDRAPRATSVRWWYFTHDSSYKAHVSPAVVDFMESYKTTPEFKKLKEEFDFIRSYREAWNGAPFPPTFVTVDSVVIKSGHVLVVRRKGSPGKGQIALPGGFLNQKETTRAGALRELKEETGIKVSKEELDSSIVEQKVFDYPGRSLRGRTITHAFLIDLGSGPLPTVKGADDADKAWWMPLSEFDAREADFFEDHFHIISHFVSKF